LDFISEFVNIYLFNYYFMAYMPKVCKQLMPAAQKNKTTRLLLSYLTTVAESLMEMESCDTCCTGKENEMCTMIIVIKVLHKMIPHNNILST